MRYRRMPIEIESPEELGYDTIDVERFYAVLDGELGTYVGPGHWFEQDRRLFRLGFGWPTTEELQRGLAALSEAATRSVRGSAPPWSTSSRTPGDRRRRRSRPRR